MRLHVGSDHAGVRYRKYLVDAARSWDCLIGSEHGPQAEQDKVDYPDIAELVCKSVLVDPGSLGVLICGTGQGVAMAANKIKGIRAATVADVYSAIQAREHNDANVICLGERVLGIEIAKQLLQAFIQASFAAGRHVARIEKIHRLESR